MLMQSNFSLANWKAYLMLKLMIYLCRNPVKERLPRLRRVAGAADVFIL
jgi:hypothetical protein